jgi:PAS domain S-box-containing protein
VLGQLSDHPPLILNVDNDHEERSAVSRLLRRAGFGVEEAASGEQALRLTVGKPDLVLLCVSLDGGIDGLEVCRRLKADAATATIPVILISATWMDIKDCIRALEEGADGYLTKPIDLAYLLAHIKALLRVRRAEEARRTTESRFRAIIERSFDAVVLLAADGTLRYASPSYPRILGYTPEEWVGQDAFDLVHPEDRPEVALRFAELVRTPGGSDGTVHRALHKDGSWRWLETRGTNLLDDPAVRAVVVNYRDITERRRLEEQLRQSQKMEAVGQLASGVAHDFNNILTAINGYGDMLLDNLLLDEPNRELVEEVKKASERAASLTRRLLAFGRKQVLAPAVLDLNEVVSEMGKLLRRTIGADIELVLHLQPGLARIRADRGQMEQVILNLALNARDAMPQGGRLIVQTEDIELDEGHARRHAEVAAGPCVLLGLSDTGRGMTPEVKAHLFEPFFTTKRPGKGTGLGLSTVYGVVRQSGGHIEVDSEPGAGTSFRIYLPRTEQPGQALKPLGDVQVAPRGSETVLLVEDDQSVRAVNRRTLRQSGYAVLDAGDGAEALRVAAQHRGPIHLLLTDVVMPGLGGRQLAEQLSALHPEARVLYVSGYPDDAVVRHGIREGEVDFLQKPFSSSVLARKVRDVLDAPSPRE